ncbi:hypothetical protein Peur_027796 [Populus x canadensis]
MRNLSSRNSTRSRSTPTSCCGKVGIKRGPWTLEEDEILANYIKKDDEEHLILRLHKWLGNRWFLIAGRIPGRTDNEIKNYWNTHLRKKLISQGIDPTTHKPLYPNPNSSEIANIAPTQNSNPNSFPLEENARVIDDGTKNWPNCDGFTNGLQSLYEPNKEKDYIGNENEDTFSLFLESLINENVFAYQQQQCNIIGPSGQPMISSSQAFHHGSIWEAEVTFSMAAFSEKNGD